MAKRTMILGVDIGGTFTDLVLLDQDGHLSELKVSTSNGQEAEAVLEGTVALLQQAGVRAGDVREVVHASTVGTNAILERKGPRVALVTTYGFRDVLEIARIRTPRLYDLTWEKPRPLVERRDRFEVLERIGADGEVVAPLDAETASGVIAEIQRRGIRDVAICLINSPINPTHEEELHRLFERLYPEARVSVSSAVLNELMEYERTSTTVVNAFLHPVMDSYLRVLEAGLYRIGITAPLHVLRSDGGMMSVGAACDRPVSCVISGPAAGVIAVGTIAERHSRPNLLAFDMGGTTAKASIISDYRLPRINEYEVRDGISSPSRFIKAGGYLLKVPAIDIAEVGSGAGSIARVDAGGALRVGPMSAGAFPGPACYGRGGEEPTVTDANLVLGYLSPGGLAGGALSVDVALAHESLAREIGQPLELTVRDAAWAIHSLANSNMIRAIRSVSVERGRDPREFALVAFGGSGPVHAAGIARELSIREIIVPRLAGLLSAVGLLSSRVEEHVSRTWHRPLSDVSDGDLREAVVEMGKAASISLESQGYGGVELMYLVDAQFVGQTNPQAVEVDISQADLAPKVAHVFREQYESIFGHILDDEPLEIVTLRAIAYVPTNQLTISDMNLGRGDSSTSTRSAYFGDGQDYEARVIRRAQLVGHDIEGPVIVEEYDTTVVVPPGFSASITTDAAILIRNGHA